MQSDFCARGALAVALGCALACGSKGDASSNDTAIEPTSGPLVVQTDTGAVRGALVGASARAFLGIPYAAPPVGDLRWKPPAAPAAWSDARDATAYGHDCMQTDLGTGKPARGVIEDCLFLNVWTPFSAPSRPAPVMVFIHGGGFITGSGSVPTYAGAKLSSRTGALVLTLNYRLGPFGFLTHSALALEAGQAGAPPFGLLDQRAALAWVKRNAAAFGGDPNDVTIFGESAGGTSVCAHLAMPGSRDLFHRAIVESGPCDSLAFGALDQATAQGDDFAKALGCSGVAGVVSGAPSVAACMRAKSADDVASALKVRPALFGSPGVLWPPVVDGTELPHAPNDAFAGGQAAPVPVILGTNRDEGDLFTAVWASAFGHELTEDEITTALHVVYSDAASRAILDHYPLARFSGPSAQGSTIITDGLFVCPTRRAARALASHGNATYLYQFVYPFKPPLLPNVGVAHSFELPFVFGTTLAGKNIGDDEEPLSNAMMGYWSRFALRGDPNGEGAPSWPRYDAASDTNVVLDATITTATGLAHDACDFWDGLR
jgi:para-nitrobenzyl esterase